MGSMSFSSCGLMLYVGVPCVHPVAVRNAAFACLAV